MEMRKIISGILIGLTSSCLFGQDTKMLKGVFMMEKDGLPGVTLYMEGDHTIGTITDINGEFQLEVPANKNFTLIIGTCICTRHHHVGIDKRDLEVKLSVKNCKGWKKTIKKIKS